MSSSEKKTAIREKNKLNLQKNSKHKKNKNHSKNNFKEIKSMSMHMNLNDPLKHYNNKLAYGTNPFESNSAKYKIGSDQKKIDEYQLNQLKIEFEYIKRDLSDFEKRLAELNSSYNILLVESEVNYFKIK